MSLRDASRVLAAVAAAALAWWPAAAGAAVELDQRSPALVAGGDAALGPRSRPARTGPS